MDIKFAIKTVFSIYLAKIISNYTHLSYVQNNNTHLCGIPLQNVIVLQASRSRESYEFKR